jgi:SAM-dependent methyltransferase
MTIAMPPPYEDLVFMTPLSEHRANALIRHLTRDLRSGTVLDLGCGWGELLLRTVSATADARGVGVDMDAKAIAHGRLLAGQRGVADRVTLICGDVKTEAPEQAEALICIGASQIWGPPVADCQPMDYVGALRALRAQVSPGARVVYGEGIWSSPPTQRAADPLSGRLDEFTTMPGLLDLAVAHGFMPVAVHEANLDEWDEFESGYSACFARWLAEHGPDHVDAAEVSVRAARQRAAYFDGYRGILGLAYLCLVAV